MPLDSSLFNDLIEGVALHVVGTTMLPKGERYSMGPPDDAWRTMCEVWSRAPSSERIIEDIDRFKKAVEKIIAAEGCYVEEFDACHGHRKSMQKVMKGGAFNVMATGTFTEKAMEGMRELESSWVGITST